ncbi:MAG: choice-of-anchor tandem repeat GloVer-containing protein [Cytophagaceae bacterium]
MKKLFSAFSFLILLVASAQAQPILVGMAESGGDGLGAIYQIDLQTNIASALYKTQGIPLRVPRADLTEGSNGKLYGLSSTQGTYGYGFLYELDPVTRAFETKITFGAVNNLYYPTLSLTAGPNGKLYGMTTYGGQNGVGTLFAFDPASGTLSVKHHFTASTGSNPFGSLGMGTNGKFYGMALGGTSGTGVIFEYDPLTDTYLSKASITEGTNSNGRMVEASNGKLYGILTNGGLNNKGFLFEYDPALASFTKKVDFNADMVHSGGTLAEGASGTLHGLVMNGGVNGSGYIYEYDISQNTLVDKLDLSSATGENPFGSFFKASNGKLYAITLLGGNQGKILEYDAAGNTCVVRYSMSAADGLGCYGTFYEASNGKLYAQTNLGGAVNMGVIFEFNLTGFVYTKLLDLGTSLNGTELRGSLALAGNGKLYGVCRNSGLYNGGVLFELDPVTKIYTKKLDFDGLNNGRYPSHAMMRSHNGKLYGMTEQGGASDRGIIFEFDPFSGAFTKKYDFPSSGLLGVNPSGTMVESSNGKFYGMTTGGGANGSGTIFEFDNSAGICTKKFDFEYTTSGHVPMGNLVEASNGKMYGVTSYGGTHTDGVLFEYDPLTNAFTKKIDFQGSVNGRLPYGSLIQAANGKLYGLTNTGGSSGQGTLFEYDPATGSLINKVSLTSLSGYSPFGDLLEASNGKLYGLTDAGGNYGEGTILEYVPGDNNVTVINSFDGSYGSHPTFSSLIELIDCDLTLSAGSIQADCDRQGSGSASVIPAHGTAPYYYQWSSGAGHSATAGSLSGGSYSVLVTDKNFCAASINITIPEPAVILSSGISSQTNVSCHGGSNGSATIAGSGGTGTLHYSWAPSGGSSAAAIQLNAGVYTVTISDDNGCTLDQTVTINEPLTGIDLSVSVNGTELTAGSNTASYQWINCNNNSLIPDETTQSYTATASGSYAVILTESTCTDTSACSSISVTGIAAAQSDESISIYPNPTRGGLTLSGNTSDETLIHIYNSTGVLVLTKEVKEKKTELDLKALENGLYFIHVGSPEKSTVKTFVKE